MLNRVLQSRLSNLVEHDATGGLHLQIEEDAQMVGDGLALAVVVRGQYDLFGGKPADDVAQLLDLRAFGLDHLVIHPELVLYINVFEGCHRAQVATRRRDIVPRTQIRLDFGNLGRRLDDQQDGAR